LRVVASGGTLIDETWRIGMAGSRHWKFSAPLFVLIGIILLGSSIAHSQALGLSEVRSTSPGPAVRNVIIVGFVGGFVSPHDTKHPEVQFAAYLRDRYPSTHVEVYGNHHGGKALHQVKNLLDTNHDGVLSSAEKQQATVIIYGHSWGATETVEFAHQLDEVGIPVALTIQIDTIGKPGHKTSEIPPNVATAINFYQAGGPLHGLPQIVAADPERTKIMGNILMTYENRPINCDNYSWYSRTINKPHHEIENDFRVWDEVASLINADLPGTASSAQAPLPSASPFFKYLRRGFQAHGTETALLETPSGDKGN
jgi:hypothetical protein